MLRMYGVGIPADKFNNLTSHGMLSMQERAREFDGTVELISHAGDGATAIARFMQQPPQLPE
jgi:signal transduction histidine kinase